MTEKQLETADELKRIIMQEIRKNPACSSVRAVEIMPAPERSAPHPNWSVSIVLQRSKSTTVAPPSRSRDEQTPQCRWEV
jgi:hypothetical protein